MTEVVELRPDVRADTVELLESALARARAGEIQGVLVVAECRGGDIIDAGTFDRGVKLMGALAFAQHVVFKRMSNK